MEFRVLGPIEVVGDDGGVVRLGGLRERSVLAALLLKAGVAVSDETLLEWVWGDRAPKSGRGVLHTAVSRLRKALATDAAVIERVENGYRLAIGAGAVDSVHFEQLIQEAEAADEPTAAEVLLQQALGLWRGEPFLDVGFEEYAQAEIRRLRELHAAARERLAVIWLDLGRERQALEELQVLVEENPYRESIWQHLMVSLYRLGRQTEALRSFQRARSVLADIGLEPGAELQRTEEAILVRSPSLDAAATSARTEPQPPVSNLPVVASSFVGRQEDLNVLRTMLQSARLVSLVGPGGVGKTRLAIELGHAIADDYPGGVLLARLAKLNQDEAVLDAVLDAVRHESVATAGALLHYLRQGKVLLILDNCELVLGGAAALADWILGEVPTTDIVATSRQRLGNSAEHIWTVEPLALEPLQGALDGAPSPRPGEADAALLFLDRVGAVQPRLNLDDPAIEEIAAEIARSVDGLPLALELAASQCYALDPEAVAQNLKESTLSLRSRDPQKQRHASLEEAIEWSVEPLDDDERAMFAAVSVVPDTWEIGAAEALGEAILSGRRPALDVVLELVERSLLVRAPGEFPEPRFNQLAPIKEYAARVLERSGQTYVAKRRHARWLAEQLEVLGQQLMGLRQADAALRIRRERWNYDSAFAWALEWEPETALRLAAAPGISWVLLEPPPRVVPYLRAALAKSDTRTSYRAEALGTLLYLDSVGIDVSPASRANSRADLTVSRLPFVPGSLKPRREANLQLADEAIEIYEELGDEAGAAFVTAIKGFVLAQQRQLALGREMLEGALESLESAGADWHVMAVQHALSNVPLVEGNYDECDRTAETALSMATQVGDYSMVLEIRARLGMSARAQSRYAGALGHFRAALDVTLAHTVIPEAELRIRIELGHCYIDLGALDAAELEFGTALRLARRYGLASDFAAIRLGEAEVALSRGSYELAHEYLDEALSLAEESSDVMAAAYVGSARGWVYLFQDAFGPAQVAFSESMRWSLEFPDPIAVARALEGLAVIAEREGELEKAATLIGSADARRATSHTLRRPLEDLDSTIESLRGRMTDQRFDSASGRGRGLSTIEAIAFAME